MNICVGGLANRVAIFNKENNEIISLFLAEIEFIILVFWYPQTVHFVGPSSTQIGGILVGLEYEKAH